MWYAHGFWLWTRPAGYQRSICRVNSIHGNFVIPRETSSGWSTKQPSCTGTRCCHRSHRESIPAEFPAPLDCFEREARCRHARQNNRLAKIWPKSWQILAALSHPSFPNQVATKTKLVAVTIRHGWIAPCYRFAGTQLAPGSMLWHRLSAS